MLDRRFFSIESRSLDYLTNGLHLDIMLTVLLTPNFDLSMVNLCRRPYIVGTVPRLHGQLARDKVA